MSTIISFQPQSQSQNGLPAYELPPDYIVIESQYPEFQTQTNINNDITAVTITQQPTIQPTIQPSMQYKCDNCSDICEWCCIPFKCCSSILCEICTVLCDGCFCWADMFKCCLGICNSCKSIGTCNCEQYTKYRISYSDQGCSKCTCSKCLITYKFCCILEDWKYNDIEETITPFPYPCCYVATLSNLYEECSLCNFIDIKTLTKPEAYKIHKARKDSKLAIILVLVIVPSMITTLLLTMMLIP